MLFEKTAEEVIEQDSGHHGGYLDSIYVSFEKHQLVRNRSRISAQQ